MYILEHVEGTLARVRSNSRQLHFPHLRTQNHTNMMITLNAVDLMNRHVLFQNGIAEHIKILRKM